MGLMDDMKQKAQDTMGDDDFKKKAEEMARKHGISVDEAKEKLMNRKDEE